MEVQEFTAISKAETGASAVGHWRIGWNDRIRSGHCVLDWMKKLYRIEESRWRRMEFLVGNRNKEQNRDENTIYHYLSNAGYCSVCFNSLWWDANMLRILRWNWAIAWPERKAEKDTAEFVHIIASKRTNLELATNPWRFFNQIPRSNYPLQIYFGSKFWK